MSYNNSVSNSVYKSALKFTVDGRPTVNDIHDLFSMLMSQVSVTTHRHMFRNYANTFSSEDAIVKLGALNFSPTSSSSRSVNLTAALKMERDMAKALLQQFLWTRLIENAVEPENRTYRDKGIWRLRSKGLCVLQDYCVKTNTIELLVQFKNYVDLSSTEPMFLIHVERMTENDRMNCRRKYISSLFAIMVASLPIRNDCNKINNSNSTSTFNHHHSRQSMTYRASQNSYNSKEFENYHNVSNNRHMSAYTDLYTTFSENSLSRHASVSSSDSGSTCSSTTYNYNSNTTSTVAAAGTTREAASITDYFPHIKILPNDLLVHANPLATSDSSFQQQKALLQNLNPSSSNKFKMRTIFTSLLCCDWLVGYCTVASNDEAESIMTEFLNLGWITFYDEKHRNSDQIESSKSIALRLTGTGMKVVIDISVDQYNDFQQFQQYQRQQQNQQQQVQLQQHQLPQDLLNEPIIELYGLVNDDETAKRYSVASSSSNQTESTFSSSILANFEDLSIATPRSPLPSIKYKSSIKSSNSNPLTPIFNISPHHHSQQQQQQMYDSSTNYFDINPPTLFISSPYYENIETLQLQLQQQQQQNFDEDSLLLTVSQQQQQQQISNTSAFTAVLETTQDNKKKIISNSNQSTNTIELKAILQDVQLRSLFREFLDYSLCAENLDFWIDHQTLRCKCQTNSSSTINNLSLMSVTKHQQLLQEAYLLWDTYLCPEASRELNIDHTLREDMAEEISQMATLINTGSGKESRTTVIISTDSSYDSLLAILDWFDRVNDQICKLMADDSIPKFIRTTEYKTALKSSIAFRQQQQQQQKKEEEQQEEINNQPQLQQLRQQQEQQPILTIMTTSDIDEFPPPPQRQKLKETIFL